MGVYSMLYEVFSVKLTKRNEIISYSLLQYVLFRFCFVDRLEYADRRVVSTKLRIVFRILHEVYLEVLAHEQRRRVIVYSYLNPLV